MSMSLRFNPLIAHVPGLAEAVQRTAGGTSQAAQASAIEFLLEGMHLNKRLNKDAVGARSQYRSR